MHKHLLRVCLLWFVGLIPTIALAMLDWTVGSCIVWAAIGCVHLIVWAGMRRALHYVLPLGTVLGLFIFHAHRLAGCGMPYCFHEQPFLHTTLALGVGIAAFGYGGERLAWLRGMLAYPLLIFALWLLGDGYKSWDFALAAQLACVVWPLLALIAHLKRWRTTLKLLALPALLGLQGKRI